MFSVKPFATTPFSTGAVLPAAVEQQNGALLGVGSFSQDTLSSGGPVVNGAVVVGVFATTAVGTVDVQVSGSADVNVNVVGIEANGAVGTVSVPIDESVTLTGIEATGAVGTVAVAADANALATGVQGSGQTGQVTVALPVEVTLTGVQGLGQVVEEPHEFNIKYATAPAGKTFAVAGPSITFGNAFYASIYEDGARILVRAFVEGPGFSGNGVGVFNLSTPFDISTATYLTDSRNATPGDAVNGGVKATTKSGNNSSYKLFNSSTRIFYTLSNSSVTSSLNYSGVLSNSVRGFDTKAPTYNDGALLDSTGEVFSFDTGGVTNAFSSGLNGFGITLSSNGLFAYIVAGSSVVHQYSLGTAGDISTAQALPQTINLATLGGQASNFSTKQITWKPDGTRFFASFNTATIVQFDIAPTTATVTVEQGVGVFVTGVSAAADVGTAAVIQGAEALVTGVQANANVGAAIVDTTGSVNAFVTGVQTNGAVGDVTVFGVANVPVQGVQALVQVGTVVVDAFTSVNVDVSGTEGLGQVGQVNVQEGIGVPVTGVQTGSKTFIVTVVYDGYGNVFAIDGVNKPTLSFLRGAVYTFNQSAATNGGHQLAFKDGTGASYTVGVVSTGTPGQAGAQTVITVAANAPDNLRYYCVAHGNYMGNTIAVGSLANTIGNVAVFGTANVAPIGVAASALLNGVTIASEGNISFDVAGAQGTGEIGQVGASGTVDVPLTGVSGTGEAGQVEATLDAIAFVQGLSTAGNVGQVQVGATNVEVTGVSASGEIGSVEVTGTCVFDVQGLAAQGQVGVAQAITAAFVTATGVDATASIGATEVLTSAVILTGGVESIGEVGVTAVSGDANVFAFGTQALGTIGVVAAGNVINVGVTGVQAVGFVGTINVTAAGSISVNVQGVTAIGQVGSLSTTGWSDIVVTQDPNWLPIAA